MLFKVSAVRANEYIIIDSEEKSTRDKEFILNDRSKVKTDKLGSVLGNKTVEIDIVTNLVLFPIHWMGVVAGGEAETAGPEAFIDKYEVTDDGVVKAIKLSGQFHDLSGMTIEEVNKVVMDSRVEVQADLLTAKEYKQHM